MNAQSVWIALIGPGGAGKSTVGGLVANDWALLSSISINASRPEPEIGDFIERFGYDAYARENVDTCGYG